MCRGKIGGTDCVRLVKDLAPRRGGNHFVFLKPTKDPLPGRLGNIVVLGAEQERACAHHGTPVPQELKLDPEEHFADRGDRKRLLSIGRLHCPIQEPDQVHGFFRTVRP